MPKKTKEKKSTKKNNKTNENDPSKNAKDEEKAKNSKKGEILTIMTGENCSVIDISLPKDFFEQIIFNEVELFEDFKYEKLNSLVQLYLSAIQYYSSFEPQKVKAYQNRLEFLLTQKDTLKNLCKLKEEKIKASKSGQIRGRAKTKFMIESKGIKKDFIKNKVNNLLKSTQLKGLSKLKDKFNTQIINENNRNNLGSLDKNKDIKDYKYVGKANIDNENNNNIIDKMFLNKINKQLNQKQMKNQLN